MWEPPYGHILFNKLVSLLCRYKSSPEEVAASCDVTFAMLADPESAVRMFHFKIIPFMSKIFWKLIITFYQVDVACGKHGAASGIGPGKGYYLIVVPNEKDFEQSQYYISCNDWFARVGKWKDFGDSCPV